MPRSSTARWLHGVAERYLRPAEGLDPDDPAAVPSTALQRRGLVVLTREYGGWKGAGEYGQLVRRVTSWTTQSGKRIEHVSELPVALTVRKGELLPPTYRWRATEETEFDRIGMPTGLSCSSGCPRTPPGGR